MTRLWDAIAYTVAISVLVLNLRKVLRVLRLFAMLF